MKDIILNIRIRLRQSLFPILRKVMKHFHFHVNVHYTISNLYISCPCIQRISHFSFTITIANANVYVNLFLFHLRSEILIIEGYYTKYPNPTISFFHFHFKESYETFSFSCSNLSLSSPYIYIQRIFLHHHHR